MRSPNALFYHHKMAVCNARKVPPLGVLQNTHLQWENSASGDLFQEI